MNRFVNDFFAISTSVLKNMQILNNVFVLNIEMKRISIDKPKRNRYNRVRIVSVNLKSKYRFIKEEF